MSDEFHKPSVDIPDADNINRANLDRWPVRRRTGSALVLSGGGALGAFQVGAIKRLWETGYRPELICGVSVGAINALKLAEGDDEEGSAAQKLEDLWDELAEGSLHILLEWAAAKELENKLTAQLRPHGAGLAATATAIPPWDSIGVGAWFAALPGWVKNYVMEDANRIYALHALGEGKPNGFRGLIDLMRNRVKLEKIEASGIKLRLGMTDLETGSLWMATEPVRVSVNEPDGTLVEQSMGRLEREPDLSRPRSDPDHPRFIDLVYATYASSAMPIYFPPLQASERPLPLGGMEVVCHQPPEYLRFLGGSDPGWRELGARWKHFYDGGLADIVPIRTAMRLGYRDITVISANPLQRSHWTWKVPDPTNGDNLPLLQYLGGFISCWGNNVARSDMMLGLAYNEFLGWIYRLHKILPAAQAREVREQFERYWRDRWPFWESVLGATSWIGGRVPTNPIDAGFEFGRPFFDEGCNIRVITPYEPLELDALGFTDTANIRSAMDIGYRRAEVLLNDPRQMTLSTPVEDTDLINRKQARERGLPEI